MTDARKSKDNYSNNTKMNEDEAIASTNALPNSTTGTPQKKRPPSTVTIFI